MFKDFILKASHSFLASLMLLTIVRPFTEANGLDSPWPYYSFIIIVALTLTIFRKKWLRVPLLLCSFFITVYYYFPFSNQVAKNWFQSLAHELKNNISQVINGNASYFPELLALLIFLSISLLFLRLAINYHHWLTAFFFSLGYLLTLAAVNYTNVTPQLITLIGAALFFAYLEQMQDLPLKNFLLKSSISLISLIVIATLAWWIPVKQTALHTKVLKETNQLRRDLQAKDFYGILRRGRGGSIGQTGFGEDDSTLGGPIIPDESLVFTAKQSESHYWRVDSKNLYSGSGWSNTNYSSLTMTESPLILGDTYTNYLEDSLKVEISPERSIPYLPLPYGKVTWDVLNSETSLGFPEITYVPSTQRVNTKLFNYNAFSTVNYSYQLPDYSIADLQAASAFKQGEEATYAQLPENLPERVRELAEELTKDSQSDYERVKRIETYLKLQGEFTYSLENAESVPDNRDYVDFFLFDSLIGYCEHFASAMVVLLRTIDIPTRWAKGFAPGTLVQEDSNGLKTYEIRNKDAHVWPEVFFEGVGWVPFEPTKSFNNPEQTNLLAAHNLATTNDNDTLEGTPANPTNSTEESDSNRNESEAGATDAPQTPDNKEFDLKQFFATYRWQLLTVSSVILLLFLVMSELVRWYWLLLRNKWFPPKEFQHAYYRLLKQLERLIPRERNQTLADYVKQLSLKNPDWEKPLQRLTTTYEQAYYSQVSSQPFSPQSKKDFLTSIRLGIKEQHQQYYQKLPFHQNKAKKDR